METHKITVSLGNEKLGPGYPVLIQSMCSVSTMDTGACVDQCIKIFEAGGGMARITARNIREAKNLKKIREELNRKGYTQPISADVHFNPSIALEAARGVEKVRINPGNFASGDIERPFLEFLKVCRENNTAIRIGVNHGSLSERILEKFGDSPTGMVESAMEYLRICRRENFNNVVVSLKSSNTRIMVYSNRLMKQKMEEEDLLYPLHTGVTEAGDGVEGRIRSAVGIGTLLGEGLGNTIRVSLTEAPELEIPVAKKLLEVSKDQTHTRKTNSTEYTRRNTDKYGPIGGNQAPVVIAKWGQDTEEPEPRDTDPEPDFYFVPDHHLLDNFPGGKQYILNAESWILDEYPSERFFPLFDLQTLKTFVRNSELLNFLLIRPEEVSEARKFLAGNKTPCCLIYMHDPSKTEAFLDLVSDPVIRHPLIIQSHFKENDPEMFQLRSASELAWYFLDGYGDGIWLDNTFSKGTIPPLTAFKILQASRSRVTETEYIACPSCGRTLFDIQDTLGKIRSATSHLKHLKIAVMGCIVNGPGEMADADYGYVGSGKGKVSLYRQKEMVIKNVQEEEAVRELVDLIKENGDWND